MQEGVPFPSTEKQRHILIYFILSLLIEVNSNIFKRRIAQEAAFSPLPAE